MKALLVLSIGVVAGCSEPPCQGAATTVGAWRVPTCGTPPVERVGGIDIAVPVIGQEVSCLVREATACALVGPTEQWRWGEPIEAPAGNAIRATIAETAVLGGSHRTGFYTCAILRAGTQAPLAVRCGADWNTDSWADEAGRARGAIRSFLRGIRSTEG